MATRAGRGAANPKREPSRQRGQAESPKAPAFERRAEARDARGRTQEADDAQPRTDPRVGSPGAGARAQQGAERPNVPEQFELHGQVGDSPTPAQQWGAAGGLPPSWDDFGSPAALAAFMGAVLSGKGTGKGAGRGPEQYAKPTAPPAFDGFRPPIEEWERKLTVWEQANPNLQNRGALLVQSLNGEPFRLVTTTMQPEEWTREAVYDEYTGEVVQQEGYATVKQLILDRYKKRRIVPGELSVW